MTGVVVASNGCKGGGGGGKRAKREVERQSQLSVIAMAMATLRKSMVYCRMNFGEEEVLSTVSKMEISWPTEVRHIAHVTFDRFNGFLGLPVEFELEVPCRAPSASVSVFGVSAESMQCGYDSKGNSVPTILLLMQERLYSQGGLKAKGIFRINPDNNEEKDLRTQLNKGIIPHDIDVHCLAALIKAWFRELPEGILDSLSPGQVLQCETEEDCVDLVKLLPPTQFALLSWTIDLMADVVEEEEMNKMNARNITMVFAPNMTQLLDPLTSLMHAVQVMNLLQTLIFRTLKERDDAAAMEGYSLFSSSSSSESGELGGNSSDEYEEDACCHLGRDTSSNFQFSFSRNSVDEEDAIAEDIEQCFLEQLELDLKEENGDMEKEVLCPRMSSGDQEEEELSCPESSTEFCIPKYEVSSSTTNGEESIAKDLQDVMFDVKLSEEIEDIKVVKGSSSTTTNEAEAIAIMDLQDVVFDVKPSEEN